MSEFNEEATQIRSLPFLGEDRILVADSDMYRKMWLRQAVGDLYGIEEVDNARAALDRLTSSPPRILVVGSELLDVSGGVLLSHAARHGLVGAHRGGPVIFLLSDSPETAAQVNEQQIPVFFRLTPQLQPERLLELFSHALARSAGPAPSRASNEEAAARTRLVLEHAKRLGATTELKAAASLAIAAVVDVTHADRARCLYYDDESGVLWSETDDGVDDESQASVGVAGFVAKAGTPVILDRAASDPTYRPHVDDPAGTGDEHLALVPVIDRERRVHAVLIAVRQAASPTFTQSDLEGLVELAQAWAPFIHQLAVESEVQAEHQGGHDEIFRQEAIQHLVRRGQSGDVVRVHPGWINSAFWVVLLAVGATAAFAGFAQVHQYAEGPSVVRITGRTQLIAFDGGSVTSVEVNPGQQVTNGQVLVRLHDNEQASRMRGLESEFERKLVAYLQTPTDPGVKEQLSALVSERDNAKASLESRVIRAPHDGIVRDVLVNVGQRVEAGHTVASVVRKDAPEGLSVLAFLPGSERPRLRLGQPLRMTLPGYRGATVESTIRAISSEVVGAAEAKARYLGTGMAEAVPIEGAVVVVEAELPATFEADGQVYELHDGMLGRSEIRLESRSVLQTAIPGLAD